MANKPPQKQYLPNPGGKKIVSLLSIHQPKEMNLRNTTLVLFILTLFSCTKDVGKDAKLHPTPPPFVSPYVGEYIVDATLFAESKITGRESVHYAHFTDTVTVSYNPGTDLTTFKDLYYLSGSGTVISAPATYSVSHSGTFTHNVTYAYVTYGSFFNITFRSDSFFLNSQTNDYKYTDYSSVKGKKIK